MKSFKIGGIVFSLFRVSGKAARENKRNEEKE
jgi:hypothetical protein